MARRLRKKRIAIILIVFVGIIVWTTHSCVSRCTSSSSKEKAEDTMPQAHLNDSLRNVLFQDIRYHEMDSIVERYLKRWEINGAQLVITRNDSLFYARGFGWADKEKGVKMEPNMLMRFASVSKLITATGIMKLWEMKKLRMGDKVFGPKGILNDTTYCNSIQDQRYYDITVEQLLRHKGGFNNYAGDPVSNTRFIMMQNHLKVAPDHQTLLKILLKRHLGYTPGQAKCYSNLGYMILSMIIEKKSGMKYEDFMQKMQKGYSPRPLTGEDRRRMAGGAAGVVAQAQASLRQTKNRMDHAMANAGLRVPGVTVGDRDSGVRLGQNSKVVAGKPQYNPQTGKTERTYITESGNEYTDRASADLEQNGIDEARFQTERQEAYLLREKRRIEQEMNRRGSELDAEAVNFSWRDMPRGGGGTVHT